jgi:hypothetical protein
MLPEGRKGSVKAVLHYASMKLGCRNWELQKRLETSKWKAYKAIHSTDTKGADQTNARINVDFDTHGQ